MGEVREPGWKTPPPGDAEGLSVVGEHRDPGSLEPEIVHGLDHRVVDVRRIQAAHRASGTGHGGELRRPRIGLNAGRGVSRHLQLKLARHEDGHLG